MIWQPIKTAPSNKLVLVYMGDSYECTHQIALQTASHWGLAWVDNYNDPLDNFGPPPTHWMPLPEPPEVPTPPSSPLLWSHDVVE